MRLLQFHIAFYFTIAFHSALPFILFFFILFKFTVAPSSLLRCIIFRDGWSPLLQKTKSTNNISTLICKPSAGEYSECTRDCYAKLLRLNSNRRTSTFSTTTATKFHYTKKNQLIYATLYEMKIKKLNAFRLLIPIISIITVFVRNAKFNMLHF